jgi:hypothetical protein
MGSSLRPWGMGRPAPWDAGGGLGVHTYKQFAQPNTGAVSGRFEARVYASKRVAESLKRLPDHGLAPATWVAWCVT